MTGISPPSTATLPPTRSRLFGGYSGPTESYDELLNGSGELRPHWSLFADAAHQVGEAESITRWKQAQRLLRQDSLAYHDPADPKASRPWELDAFPLLIPSDEWKAIAAALDQRAQLLDLILRDLFGPQNLLKRGILPPEVVYRNPGFHLPYCEPRSLRDRRLDRKMKARISINDFRRQDSTLQEVLRSE